MAEYTKQFVNPYPEGWKDLPDDSTPITAAALQQHTNAIESVEQYLEDNPIGSGSAQIDYGTTEEFEQKKDDLPVGASFYVTDDNDEAFNSNIYSLDEVRIGTFLDKPLYRKMVRKDSISKTAENINSLIGDLNIKTAIKCTFISTGENEQGTVNCSLYKSNGSWLAFAWDSYSKTSARTAYLAIEYTKVGD